MNFSFHLLERSHITRLPPLECARPIQPLPCTRNRVFLPRLSSRRALDVEASRSEGTRSRTLTSAFSNIVRLPHFSMDTSTIISLFARRSRGITAVNYMQLQALRYPRISPLGNRILTIDMYFFRYRENVERDFTLFINRGGLCASFSHKSNV